MELTDAAAIHPRLALLHRRTNADHSVTSFVIRNASRDSHRFTERVVLPVAPKSRPVAALGEVWIGNERHHV